MQFSFITSVNNFYKAYHGPKPDVLRRADERPRLVHGRHHRRFDDPAGAAARQNNHLHHTSAVDRDIHEIRYALPDGRGSPGLPRREQTSA